MSARYVAPAFPRRVELELASACNLRCTYCPRHHMERLSGFMDLALFERIVAQLLPHPETVLVLHRRGERLLHSRFADMARLVAGRFAAVQMATNATLLTPEKFAPLVEGLTFLSFSLDTPERYEQTRVPAHYADVEANILRFLDYNRGRVRTQASMVRTADASDQDCDRFIAIWQDRVDRVRIYQEHSRDGRFGSLHDPRGERRPCVMPIYEMLVFDDGRVGRCNHDWASAGLGSLAETGIAELWASPAYEELRRQHRELDLSDPVCAACDSWYPEEGNQGTGQVVER